MTCEGDILTPDDDSVLRLILPDLFEAQVNRTPHSAALVSDDESLSYTEVNARANQLARFLVRRGAGPEEIIALVLPPTPQTIVALLAVLKTGAAYLPIDPENPADRIASLLDDAHPALVLTTAQIDSHIPHNPALPRLLLDRDRIGQLPTANLTDADRLSPLLPSHPAYVIYTSGSTGVPKGVVVPHMGVANSMLWALGKYALTPEDRFLHKTSLGFDVSVVEIFWPLLAGAAMIIPQADDQWHAPEATLQIIKKHRVTALHFVPSVLQSFLRHPPGDAFDSVRLVICGGEALPADLVARFRQRFSTPLHNMYGPTEASVYVTAYECT